jgi:Leucine-rich repeat (LRR) protein
MKSKDVLTVEELSREIGVPIQLVYKTSEREKRLDVKLAKLGISDHNPFFETCVDFDSVKGSESFAIVNEQGIVIRLYINAVTGMETLPISLFTLVNLKLLCLYENKQLKSLPPKISSLQNLQLIYLHRLPLTELPSEIIYLPHLKYFICRALNLSSPPNEIAEQGLAAIRI